MSSAENLREKLHELWKKSLPLMLRRLEVINRADQALIEGALTENLKAEAAQEAHKLAGSLGIFGLQRGTECSLEVERLLSAEGALSNDAVKELHDHVKELENTLKVG